MADGWPGAVLGALLHGFHTADSGREWLVPVMLGSGMGAALVGRLLARRKAGDDLHAQRSREKR